MEGMGGATTFAQERLWILDQLDGTLSHQVTVGLQLLGVLDLDGFRKSLNHILRCHETLGAGFRKVNAELVQLAGSADVEFNLVIRDAAQFNSVEDEWRKESVTSFQLSTGPLIRGRLLRVAPEKHFLLLTAHQIVCDEWSMRLLVRELMQAYESIVEGRESALPAAARPYADYARQQRVWLQSEEAKEQLNFWAQRLRETTDLLRLPTDRPRPTIQSRSGASLRLQFPPELTRQLREFAQQWDVTVFVILMSCWAALLKRWSAQSDIVLGTPVQNRQRAEFRSTVGPLANILAIRISLQEDLTARSLLQQVAREVAVANQNADIPFHKVVSALRPSRSLAHHPLFQTSFEMDSNADAHGSGDNFKAAGLEVSRIAEVPVMTELDLSLSLRESVNEIAGLLTVSTDLFDRSTAERLLEHFGVLLRGMLKDPLGEIDALRLLSAAELTRVTDEFNATRIPYPQNRCVHDAFEAQVRRTPNELAVVHEGRSLTYSQLNRRANQLARHLRSMGAIPDGRVALCVERGIDMVIGMLACVKAGVAYVPFDPAYPPERLRYMLTDAAPAALITQKDLISLFPENSAPLIVLDEHHDQVSMYEATDLDRRELGITSRNLAYVIYTSGSTGRPKGIAMEHRAVANLIEWHIRVTDASRPPRTLQFAALGFDVAFQETFSTLCCGGTLILVSEAIRRDPDGLSQLIRAERVERLFLPPVMLHALVESVDVADGSLDSLRTIITAGEQLRISPSVSRFFKLLKHCRLENHYGPAETHVVTAFELPKNPADWMTLPPIGHPISNVRIYILDGRGVPVPIGVSGEIYIAGVGIAREYLNRPELTQERFRIDPFVDEPGARMYRSGDLGRWRPDGSIEYLGRNDLQVKIRGFRVEPGEIEAVFEAHERVARAVVLVSEDQVGEKRLLAYVVPDVQRAGRPGGESTSDAGAAVVDQWKTLYEETYAAGPLVPSFVGWNSSYTGLPIPEAEMLEWLESTYQRVASLKPRRILEIGCGVGLLLSRLAVDCDTYLGTDISATAIDRLRGWLRTRADLSHVRVEQRSALHFDDLAPGSYDTVILNSVAQCFPNIEYLRLVLERAAGLLMPGGRIFVGDVRPLGLLKVFHGSVQLHKAAAQVSGRQLTSRIARAIEQERDLLIDPVFFVELAKQLPNLASAQILLERGESDNELLRYRYDVVLTCGPKLSVSKSDDFQWQAGESTLESVAAYVAERRPNAIRVLAVPNRRLSRDLNILRLIENNAEALDVDQLRVLVEQEQIRGEDPEDFWTLGEALGFEVRVGWGSSYERGAFDVEWIAPSVTVEVTSPGIEVRGLPNEVPQFRTSRRRYANQPWAGAQQTQLIQQLRDYARERLPPYMVPAAIMVLGELPVSPNGKVDRRALPQPESSSMALGSFEPPQGEMEETLASIWRDLLGLERVGRRDNFFEIGGHSLLVVQMMQRLRLLGLSASVQSVFKQPTLAELASALELASGDHFVVPPNLIPPGCRAITPQMLTLVELSAEHIEHISHLVPGGSENIQDIYPLSPLQEGILFHHMLNEKGSDTYVLPTLLELSSREKLEQLIGAWQIVIDRHDVLRSAVLWDKLPRPVQVVHRRATLPVAEIELQQDRDAVEQLCERMKPEVQRLELNRAPLVKLQFAVDRTGGRWFALVQLHHLVGDHESLDTAFAEVRTILEGRLRELPPPVAYRNHVAQALKFAQNGDAETFFRRKLGDVHEPTAAFGLLDVHGGASRIREVRQTLESKLTRRIRSLARGLGISPAPLFHAAWGVVVSRTSGRDDVVYGSVLLGRLQVRTGAQRILGMFINTLPLRLRLQGATASQLVEQTRKGLIELLSYEQTSLAVAQQASAIPGSAPLFNSLFNYMHTVPLSEAAESGRLSGMRIISSREWTNYPITFMVDDLGEDFVLFAQTDRRLDPQRLIGYMHAAIDTLVDLLERDPESPAAAVSILPQSERVQIVETFNDTRAPVADQFIHECFEEQASRTPHAIAVIQDHRSLTYAELNAKANQLARYLIGKGVGPDELAGICVARSPEMIVGLLAILKAGGAYVPLDPSYPRARLEYMLADAAPSVILTTSDLACLLPATNAVTVSIDLKLAEIADHPTGNPRRDEAYLTADNLIYTIYTSGSTGRPKGTSMSHRAMANLIGWHRRCLAMGDGRRVVQFAALSFDVAFQEIFSTLCTGATLVLLDEWVRRDARALSEFLREQSIHRLFLPPLMLQSLAESIAEDDLLPINLEDVITAGEQLRISPQISSLFRRLEGCRFHNHYGPTETHVVTALTLPEDVNDWPALPAIGKPISNAQMYVLDEHHVPLPVHVVGEIYIGGTGVAREYLRRPELTATRFVASSFGHEPGGRLYRTGDLGRWLEDGSLEYVGRNDDQVKIRGHRVELAEIEATLLLHENVKDAAVVTSQGERGELQLIAYVKSRVAGELNPEVLRAHLRAALPGHMVPGAFVVMAEFPMTPSGKLDRGALPQPSVEAFSSRTYEPPRGEGEEALSKIWRDLLRLDPVGREDNFFELGGNSIVAMQLMVRIRDSFAIDLPIRQLFENPTLRQLSLRVEEYREKCLEEGLANGGNDMEALVAEVTSMSEGRVKELVRQLTIGRSS